MSEAPAGQCFARGTALATPGGWRAIEKLAIGDAVLDASGAARRVDWAGRSVLSAKWLAARPALLPLLLSAGALGGGLPRHAMVVAPHTTLGVAGPDGVAMVPAGLLRNDRTIRLTTPAHALDLFEILPEGGAGVIAEGVPAGRDASPDTAGLHAMLRARAAVFARAGCTPGPLRGRVDIAADGHFYGWALDDAQAWARVGVEIRADGRVAAVVLADRPRPDLLRAGIGDGACSFHVLPDPPLPADRALLVRVLRVDDGAELPGSPILLDNNEAARALAALRPADAAQGADIRAALRASLDRLTDREPEPG